MNKQRFRIIFSKTLQRLVVVSELAKCEGKSQASSASGAVTSRQWLQKICAIKPLVFSLSCALGLVSLTENACADTLIIKADPSAPKHEQPIILHTSAGVPQINIQTPNAKGLSHNKFSQFNVAEQGAVLNNSRTSTQSQQGGWVQGNPYLARGEAKVILNEVNGSSPSTLRGYVEVAGQKAEVVIANPAGIQCDGCGVINAGRATFTTGQVVVNGGELDRFVVEKGKFKVSGKGMDNRAVDYTEILAREAEANAGIWSKKETVVVSGKNTIKRLEKHKESDKGLEIVHRGRTEAGEAKPQFAIDVGELGGMYAGKIHLIGTEQGVGVRNAGAIGASSETVQIDSRGQLINAGVIEAQGNISQTAQGDVINRGRLMSQRGNVLLDSSENLHQDGLVLASEGQIKQKARNIVHSGESLAKGEVFLQGGKINANGGQIEGYRVSLEANQDNLLAKGARIIAKETLSFSTPNFLSLDNAYLDGEKIKTAYGRFSHSGSYWKQRGTDDFVITRPDGWKNDTFYDIGGAIQVDAAFLDNRGGGLMAAKGLHIKSSGKIDNTQGVLASNAGLSLVAQSIDNHRGQIIGKNQVNVELEGDYVAQSGYLEGKQLTLRSAGINQAAGSVISASDKLVLDSQGQIDNLHSRISSLGDLSLRMKSFNHHYGELHAGKHLNMQGNVFDNQHGYIAMGSGLLQLSDFTQTSGQMQASERITLAVNNAIKQNKGQIEAGELIIQAARLNNQGSQLHGRHQLEIKTGEMNNQGGLLLSESGRLLVSSQSFPVNNREGIISAGGDVDIESGQLDNQGGLIQSGRDLRIETQQGDLLNQQTNTAGSKGILSLGELSLKIAALHNQSGRIFSQEKQTVQAQQIENSGGYIGSLATQILAVSGRVINQQGQIKTQSTDLTAAQVDNNQGLIQADTLLKVKSVQTLDNRLGGLKGGKGVDLSSVSLDNTQGEVSSRDGDVVIKAQQSVNNQKGRVTAKQSTQMHLGALENTEGFVYAEKGELAIEARENIYNHLGKIHAKQALALRSTDLTNTQGEIVAENQGNITARQGLNNQQGGQLIGLGALGIQASQLDNQSGLIRAIGDLALQVSGAIHNQASGVNGSLIESQGALKVSSQLFDNRNTIASNLTPSQGVLANSLTFSVNQVLNQQGGIYTRQNGHLQIANQLHNEQGEILSTGDNRIEGDNLRIYNRGGRVYSANRLNIHSQELSSDGYLQASNLNFNLQSDFTTSRHIHASSRLRIETAGKLTNVHHLYADEGLTLRARSIENGEEGRISSANTDLHAEEEIRNEGLINGVSLEEGAKTRLQAKQIFNVGKGRIYGDEIGIVADVLHNSDKRYTDSNGDQVISGVIAARQRLDIGVREMENDTLNYLGGEQTGSTLFSLGDIAIGRTLDAAGRAQGQAELVRNSSSVIEGQGNIFLGAKQIDNNNRHFLAEHVVSGKVGNDVTLMDEHALDERYIIPENRMRRQISNPKNADKGIIKEGEPHIPLSDVQWVSWSRAGQYVGAGEPPNPVMLRPGERITRNMVLATRNENVCDSSGHCHYLPAGQYRKDSPIWAYVGAVPPTEDPPAYPFDDLAKQPWFNEAEWFHFNAHTQDYEAIKAPQEPGVAPVRPVKSAHLSDEIYQQQLSDYERALAVYQHEKRKWDYYNAHVKAYHLWEQKNAEALRKLDEGIERHNSQRSKDADNVFYRKFWRIHLKHYREDESKVLRSQAGQILAGGSLDFHSDRFVNNRSTVIAGREMALKDHVENLDEEGLHRVTHSGTSQWSYSRWRGGVKRYFDRRDDGVNGYVRVIETPFDMNIYSTIDNAGALTQLTDEAYEQGEGHTLDLSEVGQLGLRAVIGVSGASFGQWSDSTVPSWQAAKGSTLKGGLKDAGRFAKARVPFTGARQLERKGLENGKEVRYIQPQLGGSSTMLYRFNSTAKDGAWMSIDPDFAASARWWDSDYMLKALNWEHGTVHKRLGDGMYEQRLVREQINRLTGRQYLGNYRNFNEQYKALMDAGVSFAKRFNLRPGVALSPSQVAQLTHDIVWLENKRVTLPDGRVANALVPRVYAVVKKGDVTGDGTLLSAGKVSHDGGYLKNQGVIAGREVVKLDSKEMQNEGTISGGVVTGHIKGDVKNFGGTIEADKAIVLKVDGHFRHASTQHTTEVDGRGYQRQDTTVGRQALLYVKDQDGQLKLDTGNLSVQGGEIRNDGRGLTFITAKNRIELGILETGFSEQMGEGDHSRREGARESIVSRISGQGKVLMKARTIESEGGELDAQESLVLIAEKDIFLGSAKNRSDYAEYHRTTSGSAFGNEKKTTLNTYQQETKTGTKLGGSYIVVSAGNDVKAQNLQAIADKDLLIKAGNNVTITNDTNWFKTTSFEEKSKSGVFSGGGIGVTFGKKSETHEQQSEGWQGSEARSTLGSLTGNITVSAGNHAHLLGVDGIVSKELDRYILVEGKSTYIGANEDTLSSKERHEQKQSGLSVAFSSAVTDGVLAAKQALDRSGQVKDKRLDALLKVKAANEAYETVKKAQSLIETIQNASNVTEAAGNSDFKISVSVGASKNVSTSHTQQTTHKGSELDAGKVIVRATDGDNTIEGSKINATRTELEGNNVNLLGTTDTQTNRSDNKSSSWSVGAFIGKSQGSSGLGVEGAVNVGKGYANSDSKVQNLTEINSDSLSIKTKETTTLKGAVANINHLALETQNLHIESVQDTEKYDSKQSQVSGSGSLALGANGLNGGVSAQFSQNKAKVDYAQVNQQSGFNIQKSSNINVTENTHLKGGIINAEGDKANHQMTTGTLTMEAIENHSDVKVSSVSVGVSSDMSKMATMAVGAALSALGNMRESERSQTKAAISSNINLSITDSDKQKALTGKTAEETLQSLNRDTANANQAVEKADLNAIQEKQETAQVIGELSISWTNRLVQPHLDEANKKRQEAEKLEKSDPLKSAQLKAEAKAIEAEYGLGSNLQMGVRAATAALQGLATGNANQAAVGLLSPYANKLIKEQTTNADGSVNTEANLMAHAVLGALEAHITGNNAAAGAIGAFTAEAAAPYLMQALYNTDKAENLTDSQKQNIANLSQIAAGLAGGVTGDSTADFVSGAKIGKRAVENNYLSKQDWIDYSREIAACGDNQECIKGVKDEFSDVNRANSEALKAACRLGGSSEACSEHTKAAQEGFDYARSNIQFDNSGWMASMMNTNKREAKIEPSQALLGSEAISNIEKALSDPNVRARLENDLVEKSKLETGIDQAAKAVRTEKGNAYEFGARMEYPNIAELSNDYAIFGRELGAEPVVPEYYIYSALGAGKIGKSLFDLSSPSTRVIVGANTAVSAGSQYLANGEISVADTLKDTAEAYVTKGFNFRTYTAWNLGTGFIEGGLEDAKWQDGRLQGFSIENALERAGSKTVTSTLGYGFGKGFENSLNKSINTYGNSLRTEPIRIGSPITRFVEPSLIPVGVGNIFDSSTSKSLETYWNNYNLFNGGKNENSSK